MLYRFVGPSFTQVVNAYLEADNQYGRLDGLGLAPKRPDDRTIADLVRISLQDDLWDGEFPCEQGEATQALAALGRYKEIADSMLKWGLRTLTAGTDRRIGEAGASTRLSRCVSMQSRVILIPRRRSAGPGGFRFDGMYPTGS